MHQTPTYEVLTRKVSLSKLNGNGKDKGENVIGCEYSAPLKGKPYSIYMRNGKVFKTSSLIDIRRTYTAFLLRTKNSIYQIKYL